MSNPARAPTEPTAAQLALMVAPDAYLPEGFADFSTQHKSIGAVQKALSPLAMDLASSFFVPRSMTVSRQVLNSRHPVLASAKVGAPVPRKRSSIAKSLVNRAYSKLWADRRPIFEETIRGKVYVDGGTEATLGRLAKAYPKVVGDRRLKPITAEEAMVSVRSCGLDPPDLPDTAWRPFPLLPVEGEEGISVNPNSDNGFPVLGKWSTDGAAEMCMRHAVAVERALAEVVDSPKGVWAWLRELEESKPYFVALMGKAKADYYSPEKVATGMMRFYNVFPRHMLLNMQKVTQVLERNARHILDDPLSYHSGIGVALNRGGAEALVKALEMQIARWGWAFVHVGDDSWVIVEVKGMLIMFALDCSNFDLTQHGSVTEQVHLAIHKILARSDKASADLWYAYMRERLVVTARTVVRRWRHGGPSGAPLQSKVNDVLMDVMIRRLLLRLRPELEEEDHFRGCEYRIEKAVEEVGASMGFSVRLEQCGYVHGNIRSYLYTHPFLFIGYYFHQRHNYGKAAGVQCDLPRTMAQAVYPTLKWEATKEDLELTEAMRLGSIAMNLGIPTWEDSEAVEEFRRGALDLLARVLRSRGDHADARLRWAVQENPFSGVAVEASLSGLFRALTEQTTVFWLEPRPVLAAPSVQLSTWADEVEAEEAEAAGRIDLSRPAGQRVRAAPLVMGRAPTHPATMANDGRPPPTAIWHAPRPPRAPLEIRGANPRARRYRRQAVLVAEDSEEEEFYSPDGDFSE